MIEIKNISQAYGNTQVLREVNLIIKEKRITALIGANGAGKSTLLNVAANLLEPCAGTVLLDGKDIKEMKSQDIAKRIAILKQTQHLNMRISVRDLVSFGRYPHSQGRLKDEDEQKIRQAIEYMNLKEIENKFIDELSGGQRQRAYIAMILAQDTKYIFLDEPLNNLDIKYSVEMMTILRKLVKELSKTVIIVMHDINFAAAYADDIVAMKGGQIMKEGAAQDIIDQTVLTEVFDHEFCIANVYGKKVCVYFPPEDKSAKGDAINE
ncbi:ATP-binding cassette domain-containing protein [Clostridium sp. D2Q-14]|uniref:iron ABC transporter ATP-binding protein n=1 Tax=Anaeromonas gelatinilytica TaxID=2683194 RepID=UPI00193B805C|nr:ATP-binding cassette domain-containing protein [Anaeromonas gelatinilytica]MBS4534041.1 ATP-binding cassette domain-containing protein [Anaeromonas gelatinilytica]